METPNECPTYLISDAPAPKDAFGPHTRVANAISKLIQEETGGKVIGLEGGWGTGKSTVVGIVVDSLKDKPSWATVLFDAWAHQGDPLRRTFLDQTIDKLQSLQFVDRANWQNKRDELAKRRKVVKTTSLPELTRLGKLLLATTLLIPIGLAW